MCRAGPGTLSPLQHRARLTKFLMMAAAGFHPRAELVEPTDGRVTSSFIGVPAKIVIHTTEGDSYTPMRDVYFPHKPPNHFWPHATITEDKIFQHFPINRSVF